MKTVSIDTLFKIKAWHPATYYNLPRTTVMMGGNIPVKIISISEGVMEASVEWEKNDQMIKTSGVKVLEKDIIRMYFEASSS